MFIERDDEHIDEVEGNEDCDLDDSLRIPLDSDDDYFDDSDGDY